MTSIELELSKRNERSFTDSWLYVMYGIFVYLDNIARDIRAVSPNTPMTPYSFVLSSSPISKDLKN